MERLQAPALKGCEQPRIWTPERRPLTKETSRGFECIMFAEHVLGITLMPWQKFFLIHALELNEDGLFRFRNVVLLVARQNGKSTILQVLSLWRMFLDSAQLVIGTAQNLDIAEEVWQGAVTLCEEVPELASEIDQILRVNGKKQLRLKTGERYKVAAASRRGGRGLSGELVLLDELREHQSWDAWAAVTKTTMARERAQVYCASNAGDASSVVLRFLRKQAHIALGDPDGLTEFENAGFEDIAAVEDDVDLDSLDDESLGIFEWSAPHGCSIGDRAGWAQANPALGHTISEKAIASAARTDPEWVFRTEVLCQWSDGTLEGPFPAGTWDAGRDADSRLAEDALVGLCVDVSWDRSMAHIGLAGQRSDGKMHVEIIASRAGTEWVVPWLASPERSERLKGAPIAVQASGAPVTSLIEAMVAEGLNVVEWRGTDLGAACGTFYDLVRNDGLRHLPQPVLDVAAATATTRPLGDAWVWDRKHSPMDCSPLVAVTGATFVAGSDAPYDLLASVF